MADVSNKDSSILTDANLLQYAKELTLLVFQKTENQALDKKH